MKTIHQRLQSRISHRRNAIRVVETDVAIMSRRRSEFLEAGFDMTETFHGARRLIRELAADQKLDKQLANVLTGVARQRRPSDFEASW